MSSKDKVPDAWDDDWTYKADEPQDTTTETAPAPKKLSKAERRAQQAELNKKLWEEAEAPDSPYYVQTTNEPPLQSGFKPNLTLLSRKPVPAVIARKDPVSGIEQLSIDDDDEDEEGTKPKPLTAEERALNAQKEREEKQKRYDEVRERLFGPSGTSSGAASPRSTTPTARGSAERGRGRGRGTVVRDAKENRDSRPGSSSSGKVKQLFDPTYAAKPDSVYLQKKDSQADTEVESQIIRSPRGPDGSGRGGIGFVSRGGKT